MKDYFHQYASPLPLVILRIALGGMVFVGVCRFWLKGWIEELYIRPKFFFSFYGFEFVRPLGSYTYILFAVCAISALLVAIGLYYRASILSLFISFTYIELIDKSTYLNHYYFISMICLLMIFMPANVCYSFDVYRNKNLCADRIPRWCVDSVTFFVCLVYFLAGLAKVNSDWLMQALPLRIWLPSKNDLPIIGSLFNKVWVAYAFSWFGCLYDLSIPFLLLFRRTRPFAFVTVVAFHLTTAILFPIGMFPYIMIATTLIFFSPDFLSKIITRLLRTLRIQHSQLIAARNYDFRPILGKTSVMFVAVFLSVQLALPFRYLLYPGELFWTEEGYRFSWRVMLMEKAGYAEFTIRDNKGNRVVVNNNNFLSTLQEKMMTCQPDMILQYAHLLKDEYTARGFHEPEVYVDSYVSLNGRMGRPLISPATNLANETESLSHKSWIIPFEDEIKGF